MRSDVRYRVLGLGLLACLGCTACESARPVPAQPSNTAAAGLSLKVLDESFIDGAIAQGFALASRRTGDVLDVRLLVRGARGLKALYCDLRCAEQGIELISAEPSRAFSSAGRVLSLAVPDGRERGVIHLGMVLANYPQRAGLSGDGVVAQLRLRMGSDGLRRHAAHAASAVPDTGLSAARLIYWEGQYVWYYFNQGDYDQNGEVNIADLTPLGAHFGATGPFEWRTDLACIDGDDNGELNIADITPLGNNFGNSLDGYRVYYSFSSGDYPADNLAPNGPGALLSIDAPFYSAIADPGKRKYFSVPLDPPGLGNCHWARPYLGSAEGTPSNMYVHTGSWHTQVVTGGTPGFKVGSHCSLAPVDGSPAIAYYGAGDPLYIRAVDSLGQTWGGPVQLMNDLEDNGLFNSLAVIGGKPAVAFYDLGRTRLTYIPALDAAGTTWDVPAAVEDATVSSSISLAQVDGRPAVAYDMHGAFWQVMYERSGDAAATDWSAASLQIDGGLGGGHFASLAVIGGVPAVAFQLFSPSALLAYTYANDADGASWVAPLTLDSGWMGGDETGIRPRLFVVDGNPAVAFQYDSHAVPGSSPYYLRASDAQGTGPWDAPAVMDLADVHPSYSGQYLSAAVCLGKPAVAYYDQTNGLLVYVSASDASGASWPAGKIIDDGGGTNDVGNYCSLAEINGRPAIAYYDTTNETLEYAVLF